MRRPTRQQRVQAILKTWTREDERLAQIDPVYANGLNMKLYTRKYDDIHISKRIAIAIIIILLWLFYSILSWIILIIWNFFQRLWVTIVQRRHYHEDEVH